MLVCIEAAIADCVKRNGKIGAASLTVFCSTPGHWLHFGQDFSMTSRDDQSEEKTSPQTLLTHGGRLADYQFGFVNTPVFRGSTVLFNTLDELDQRLLEFDYGRTGNPSTRAVENLVTELEGAAGTVLAPSGLAAISTVLLAVVSAGDEVLVTDSVYEPTRNFCRETLGRLGIRTTFHDPRIGGAIADLITDRTRVIVVESPGSLTFELQDLPAIVAAAKGREICVIVDNSWATPLYYNPLALGAGIVVHAGTKMFVGHSDTMFGTASANETWWPRLKRSHRLSGVCASPDDAFLAARGMRTLAIRMKEHEARALELAQWLARHPLTRAVYHPALPSHPDHAIWKRDFRGSGSVFSFRIEGGPREAVAAMVNDLKLWGMGYSWGGYESLCLPIHPETIRTAVRWQEDGCMFRVHVGFEDIEDLKADLAAGLDRYAAVISGNAGAAA
jgi:cystathionine beta-lyase